LNLPGFGRKFGIVDKRTTIDFEADHPDSHTVDDGLGGRAHDEFFLELFAAGVADHQQIKI
jgi:hypothetical protein